MHNKYLVRGDDAIIFLRRKNGEIFEAVIDAVDLPKVQAIEGTFYPMYHKEAGIWYARCDLVKEDGKKKLVLLHRTIADTPRKMGVACVDGDGLNCRRRNLINKGTFTPSKAAIQEAKEKEAEEAAKRKAERVRPEKPPADAKPDRGVTWHKATRRWYVSGYDNSVRYSVGYFDPEDWRRANQAIALFREEGCKVLERIKKGDF